MRKRIVVVLNIAGLSPALLEKHKEKTPNLNRIKDEGTYRRMKPSFPALTCSVQATLLTGKPPSDHGIVGNGFFDENIMRPLFWAQEASLVRGPRIWDIIRERDENAKVAVLFWQNSKYIDADIVITPAPLHTDEGMIEHCYSKPRDLYKRLSDEFGLFRLMSYWGPLAGAESSEWITNAALKILENETPDMTLLYIPHLDYICQRAVPTSDAVINELPFIDGIVGKFLDFRDTYGADNLTLFVVSEYGLTEVKRSVSINRILREHNLLKVIEIEGGEYIDFELSDSFAVVDHQIAHIYCRKIPSDDVKKLLLGVDGIAKVLDKEEQKEYEIAHKRSGDLIALADDDCWFNYYYWDDEDRLPFFAHSVDIHNKPGYDPCELFIDPETKKIPTRPELVKGSHGLLLEDERSLAVMLCTDKGLDDYAPEPFYATQFLAMLYRVI